MKRDEKNLKILHEANKEIVESCPILCSGYEMIPIPAYGWIEPVKKMCLDIEKMNNFYKTYGLKATLSQCKEKFGVFTCYFDIQPFKENFNDEQYNVFQNEVINLIESCEKECCNFCMDCGNPISKDGEAGHQKCETHGWITYICDECAKTCESMYFNEVTKKWYLGEKEVEDPYKNMRSTIIYRNSK